jgi:hypothetical protein
MVLVLTTMKTTNSVYRNQNGPATVDEGTIVAPPDNPPPGAQSRELWERLFPSFNALFNMLLEANRGTRQVTTDSILFLLLSIVTTTIALLILSHSSEQLD